MKQFEESDSIFNIAFVVHRKCTVVVIILFLLPFVTGFSIVYTGQINDSLQKKSVQPDSVANYFLEHRDYDKAVLFFKNVLDMQQKRRDLAGMVETFEKISYTLQKAGRYKEAIPYELSAVEMVLKTASSPLEPYYQKVKELYPKSGDSLNLTRLYYKFALLLSNKGAQKRSLDYFREALKLAHALRNNKAVSTIANDLAGNYWDLGEKNLSTALYEEALAAAVQLNDSNRMAAIYLNIGDNYKEMGDFEKGMSRLIKALAIKESIADSSHLSFYYIKAAEIAKAARNHKQWKKYIERAYDVKDLDNCANSMEKAIIYQNLGDIARKENHNDLAFRYFDTVMEISSKINYVNGIKASLSSLSELYHQNGKPEKALKLLLEADKYPSENPFNQIVANNSKAELYMETGRYGNALQLLKENIRSPYLSNYASEKLITLRLLYEAEKKSGHYKEAFRWNDSLRNFENRLRDKDVRTKIAELETKYQTEKKEHTIKLLTAKNEIYNQYIRLTVLLIIILIITILAGIFIFRLNKLKAEYRVAMLEQQLLRSQMNPHFIFNAMASIQEMINSGKTKDASFYLTKFSSITRTVLEYSKEESIPLYKELEMLESYIELEKLRSGGHFDYQTDFGEDLDTEFINIPPMAIQPFVENAIKHGLMQKEEKGMLLLSFNDLGDILEVTVEDNGLGINFAKQQNRKNHRSMAMEIFEMRRQLMQKRYKKKFEIRFTDLSEEGETGTRVTIHLPIIV